MSAFGSVTTMLARPAIKWADAQAARQIPQPTEEARARVKKKAERHGTGLFFLVVGSLLLTGGLVVVGLALHRANWDLKALTGWQWMALPGVGLFIMFVGAMRLDPDISGAITATGNAVGDAAGKIKSGVKS